MRKSSLAARAATLAPLETLLGARAGAALALPGELQRLYGALRLPAVKSRPYVYSNFVTTLDGIVSLHVKGHAAGGDISGFSSQDRMVMGLLRALADAVVVGSGSLKADPLRYWTPDDICPELTDAFGRLRARLGMLGPPLNVVVSASGALDLRLPVFSSGQVQALILTSQAGAKRLARHKQPPWLEILALRAGQGELRPAAIVRAISARTGIGRILVEGGPKLVGDFYAQRLLDEQFLTLAPQVAGRKEGDQRPGLVMGQNFAPRSPRWGTLIDARRGGSHLFLRFSFP